MARVAFCQDVLVEYMSFMCMSAVLKQHGHATDVFIDEGVREDRLIENLKRFRPDVVAFSLLTPSVPWALRVARRVKREIGAITIVGNVHVMMSPGIVEEDGVDIACLGEGEFALLELCAALDAGTDWTGIHGLWVKTRSGIVKNPMREKLVDMDEMPFVDRTMYNKHFFFRHSPYLRVMLGRGCPFRCSFCSNPKLMDHYGGMREYVRKRSPATAIAEVKELIRQHPRPVKHIFFIDEVLWVKNAWLREFLDLWKKEVAMPFTASFRFGGITEDDIRLLAEAGAGPVSFATETADEATRKNVLKKPVSNEHLFQIAEWLHRYGVEFCASQFFGLPGEKVEDYVRYLDFFRKVKPTYLWTTFFQPYPGLELTEQLAVQQFMPDDPSFSETCHHDMFLDLPDRQRLVHLKKVYYLMLRFPRLQGALLRLTKLRTPRLFDALFLSHFMLYAFWWEKISVVQWLYHVKIFALNPLLRGKQPLQSSGRPYVSGAGPQPKAQSTAAP